MDARTAKTARALRAAVLELATRKPIDEVTAVELVAAAGITRRTFYNHAPSPQELLASVLRPELDAVHAAFSSEVASGVPLGDAWTSGEARLAEHLREFADVYGAGITSPRDHMSPTLSHLLSDSFEVGVLETLRTTSELDDAQALMTARFVGHGLVGAIEAWLATAERSPQAFAASALRSIPSWITGVEPR